MTVLLCARLVFLVALVGLVAAFAWAQVRARA